MKKLLLLLLLVVVAVIGWGVLRRSTPPSISFVRVQRETLVSTLPTNGKVEPYQWQAVRAEVSGVVSRVEVADGRSVSRGDLLASTNDPTLQAAIDAAQAKLEEAKANLAGLRQGIKPSETTEIDNSIARARLDQQQTERELASLQRLIDKHAAPAADAIPLHNKLEQLQAQISGLEKRRAPATPSADIAAAEARVRDAQVALTLATQQGTLNEIRAPMSGVVYGLVVRPGAYVTKGDLLVNIGVMDRLRVRVYIDEPELGRVALGLPVTITWQALPGKQWQGTVEQRPTSIEALGSRQVGQVICTIENAGRELIPGTNVDAVIRTAVVQGAISIPKETLRHDPAGDYVFVLNGDSVLRRTVKTGNASVTRIQILDGLVEGNQVALPSDVPLKSGDRVTVVAAPRT